MATTSTLVASPTGTSTTRIAACRERTETNRELLWLPPPRPTNAGGQLAQPAGTLSARAAITPGSPEVTFSPSERSSAWRRSRTTPGFWGTTRSEGGGTPAQAARNAAAVAVASTRRDGERLAGNDDLQRDGRTRTTPAASN